jgi:hypothetical protein
MGNWGVRSAVLGDVSCVKLSRVLCGCVGDENGLGSRELSVDDGDGMSS